MCDEIVHALDVAGQIENGCCGCSYSSGPLPEDLISSCPVPVSIVWGAGDPWEKVAWGRELGKLPNVQKFTELAGVGHCPQDESPHKVNPLIKEFVQGCEAKA